MIHVIHEQNTNTEEKYLCTTLALYNKMKKSKAKYILMYYTQFDKAMC